MYYVIYYTIILIIINEWQINFIFVLYKCKNCVVNSFIFIPSGYVLTKYICLFRFQAKRSLLVNTSVSRKKTTMIEVRQRLKNVNFVVPEPVLRFFPIWHGNCLNIVPGKSLVAVYRTGDQTIDKNHYNLKSLQLSPVRHFWYIQFNLIRSDKRVLLLFGIRNVITFNYTSFHSLFYSWIGPICIQLINWTIILATMESENL